MARISCQYTEERRKDNTLQETASCKAENTGSEAIPALDN